MATVAAAGTRYPAALLYWLVFHFDAASGADAAKRVAAINAVCAMAMFRTQRLNAEKCAASIST